MGFVVVVVVVVAVVGGWVVVRVDGDDGTTAGYHGRDGVAHRHGEWRRRGEGGPVVRCVDATAQGSAEAAEGDADDVVEDALEVVEEDGVRGAFEDER